MVSARLRQLRRQLRLTQAAFGQRLGVSRDVIGNIEYGRVAPKPVFLQHVCHVFRVNPAWLLEGEDPLFRCEPARTDDLDEVISLFSDLTPSFRAYALDPSPSVRTRARPFLLRTRKDFLTKARAFPPPRPQRILTGHAPFSFRAYGCILPALRAAKIF